MFSKMLLLTLSMISISSVFAADRNAFLDRKESYYTHRKENFKRFNKEARKHGPIHETVQELPQEIFTHLEYSKTGEFDKSNKSAVFQLMYYATNGNFSQNFTVKELGGGFVSGKIYKITDEDTQRSYFIKYLRKRKVLVPEGRILGEQANLNAIMQNPYLNDFNWRGSIHSLNELRESAFHYHKDDLSSSSLDHSMDLKIVLPTDAYHYTFNGKKKIFMILPGAKGQSLASIIEESLTPSSSPASSPKEHSKQKHIAPIHYEKVCEAFGKVGMALGGWQVSHNRDKVPPKMKAGQIIYDKDYFANLGVFNHGDFHSFNIFIQDHIVSLIDAETISNSFTPDHLPNAPIYYDFFYLMLMTERHFEGAMASMNWDPFKVLIKSYVDSYPQEMREGLRSYFYHHFMNIKKFDFTDIFEHFTWKKSYSKSAIKGAQEIARFIVQDEYEQLSKAAQKTYGKGTIEPTIIPLPGIMNLGGTLTLNGQVIQNMDYPLEIKKEEQPHMVVQDDENNLIAAPRMPRRTGGKVSELISQHNRFIEEAQPKPLHTPSKHTSVLSKPSR